MAVPLLVDGILTLLRKVLLEVGEEIPPQQCKSGAASSFHLRPPCDTHEVGKSHKDADENDLFSLEGRASTLWKLVNEGLWRYRIVTSLRSRSPLSGPSMDSQVSAFTKYVVNAQATYVRSGFYEANAGFAACLAEPLLACE